MSHVSFLLATFGDNLVLLFSLLRRNLTTCGKNRKLKVYRPGHEGQMKPLRMDHPAAMHPLI